MGYSSLSRLSSFPVDILKIDKSFIDGVTADQSEQTGKLVSGIIAMAHTLRLTVVAEGVEHDEQRSFLQRNGCDELQGFLFARPMAPAGLEALIARTPGVAGPTVDPSLTRTAG